MYIAVAAKQQIAQLPGCHEPQLGHCNIGLAKLEKLATPV
jgi:hypothetical protein